MFKHILKLFLCFSFIRISHSEGKPTPDCTAPYRTEKFNEYCNPQNQSVIYAPEPEIPFVDINTTDMFDDSEYYLIPALIKYIKEYLKPVIYTDKVDIIIPDSAWTPVPDSQFWKKIIVLNNEKWSDEGEKWLNHRNAYLEWWGREAELSMGLTDTHELFGDALKSYSIKDVHLCDELKDKYTTESLESILFQQFYTETGDIFTQFDEFVVLRVFSMLFCKKIWILAHASWATHPYLQFTYQTFIMPINLKVEWDVVRLGGYWDMFVYCVEKKQMGLNRKNVSYMLWSLQGHINPEVRDHILRWSHNYLRTKYPEEYNNKEISYCFIDNPDDLAHIAKCMILWYETPYYDTQVTYPQLIDLDYIF